MSGVGRLLDTGLGLLLPLDRGIERVDLIASRLSARLRPWRRPDGTFSEEKDMAIAACVIQGGCAEGDEPSCPLLYVKRRAPGC